MSFYFFMLGALAVWRVTHLLHAEDGPGDLIAKIRAVAGRGLMGKAMDCFYCLSVWVAASIAGLLSEVWGERVLLWPALSGAAILLERLTSRSQPRAAFIEDAGDVAGGTLPNGVDSVQLRQ
jgi:hypothetical protein